ERVLRLEEEAHRIAEEDRLACLSIGRLGAAWLQGRWMGVSGVPAVLTHCNAGALATAGIGTALGIVRVLAAEGPLAILAGETRPFLQGARLTAWELRHDGLDVTLLPDVAAASLIRRRPDDDDRPLGARRRVDSDRGTRRLGSGLAVASGRRLSVPRARRRVRALSRLRRDPRGFGRRDRHGAWNLLTAARRCARAAPLTMKSDETLVLGLETSCDETAVALLDGAGGARTSRVSSQEEAHRRFGGVVPAIAARAHLETLPLLLDVALADAGASLADVTAVAATAGPGLVGALLVGLSEGKGLALGLSVPFVPVNHIEGHALSPFLDGAGGPAFPVPETFAALVVSGGHTHVFRFEAERIERLARTRDDAAGEAFDKVAKMAGLGYPGGPAVDRLARRGRAARPFPVPHFKDGSPDF